MAITELKRKTRTNRARANNQKNKIKRLRSKPVEKNVDVEAIKKEFEEKKKNQ